MHGDSAYASQKVPIVRKAPQAKDFTNQRTRRNRIVFGKVRYRCLAKNTTRAFTALALTNIYLSRQRPTAQVRP